jgi:hypothetical protein
MADYNFRYRSKQTNLKRHKTVRATSEAEAHYGLDAIGAIEKNKDARSIPGNSLLSRVKTPSTAEYASAVERISVVGI